MVAFKCHGIDNIDNIDTFSTMSYGYDTLGNIFTKKTITQDGDNPVDRYYTKWFGGAAYGTGIGEGGPHTMSAASGLGGNIEISYDDNGNMEELVVESWSHFPGQDSKL